MYSKKMLIGLLNVGNNGDWQIKKPQNKKATAMRAQAQAEPERTNSTSPKKGTQKGRSSSTAQKKGTGKPVKNKPLNQYPEIMTLKEVGEYLRLSRATLYRMIDKGELHGLRKIGGSVRIVRGELKKILARKNAF